MKILGLLLLLGWRAFVQATIVPTTSITTSTITTTLTSISTSVLYSTSTVLVYSTVPTCASSVSSSRSTSISTHSSPSSSVSTSSRSSSRSVSSSSLSSSSTIGAFFLLSSSSTSTTSSASRSSASSTTSSSSGTVSLSSSLVSSPVPSASSPSSSRVSSSSSRPSSSATASSCPVVPLTITCGPGTTESVLNGQYNMCELGLPSFPTTPGISAFTPPVITGYCLNDCVTAGGFAATTDANDVCLCYTINVCAYGGTDITIPAVQPGAPYSLTYVLANNPKAPGCCSGAPTPQQNSLWQPTVGTPWQIVLSHVVNPVGIVPNVPIFDIDLVNTPTSTIAALHAQGKKVICYFSAGTIDNFRPDYDEFQSADFGNALSGWPGQWYADITHQNVWNINQARIQLAAQKGCDAIDPDNMDGYNNNNGLGLTTQDSINYFTFLAQQANGLGLAIGLKNALAILPEVGNLAQFAVNEVCLTWNECGDYDSFIATKPVFHIEYTGSINGISKRAKRDSLTAQFCPTTSPLAQMSTVIKTLDLDGIIEYCDGSIYNTPVTN